MVGRGGKSLHGESVAEPVPVPRGDRRAAFGGEEVLEPVLAFQAAGDVLVGREGA